MLEGRENVVRTRLERHRERIPPWDEDAKRLDMSSERAIGYNASE